MKRSRIILIAFIAGLLITLLIIFLRQSKRPELLTAGDVVATNIRFSDKIENREDGSLTYFTGSAVTELRFPGSKGTIKTEGVHAPAPFKQADRVSYSNGNTVVRSFYTKADDLLFLDDSNQYVQNLSDGRNWFTVGKDGKAKPFPFLNHSLIADAIINDEAIYVLVTNGNGTQDLMRFSVQDDTVIEVSKNTSASSFIGAKNDTVFMRDLSGKAFVYKNGSVKEFAQNVGEARFDYVTRMVVLSEQLGEQINEEGGVISSGKESGFTLKAYDENGSLKKEVTAQSSFFSVSRGYLITIPSLSQPTNLSFTNLMSDETFDIQINQGLSRVSNIIREIHIINDDLSLLVAITTNNQLVPYGNQRYVSNLASFKLPVIRNPINDYGYQYNVASNRLTIYYPSAVIQNIVVSESLRLFIGTCDCDPNQISIQWEATASDPGY